MKEIASAMASVDVLWRQPNGLVLPLVREEINYSRSPQAIHLVWKMVETGNPRRDQQVKSDYRIDFHEISHSNAWKH